VRAYNAERGLSHLRCVHPAGNFGESYVNDAPDHRQRRNIITILVPKQDYDRWVLNDTVRIVLLILLVVAATVGCSYFFSRRYLSPIKKGLEQLKQKEYNGHSDIKELDDLFNYFAEQNRIIDAQLADLQRQKVQIQSTLDKISAEKDEAEQKAARLAYSRKNEVDPYRYEQFLNGIKALTPMEHTIFNYYLEGKSVKEIVVLADIKESTVRFHNRNIYSKLGVKSLKELLLLTAFMKQNKEG
jgi:DNA-binding CsgD family transcriptional regulator